MVANDLGMKNAQSLGFRANTIWGDLVMFLFLLDMAKSCVHQLGKYQSVRGAEN
jgi:hypothetical protein